MQLLMSSKWKIAEFHMLHVEVFFLPNNDIHLLTRYVVTLHMLMSLTKNYS